MAWGGLVLNLIINGIPSIQEEEENNEEENEEVLNLIINGIPSIQFWVLLNGLEIMEF